MSGYDIAFEERCLCSLRFSPQMVLWALRYWVQAYQRDECPMPMLEHGFQQNGIHGAAAPFHAFLLVLTALSNCTIEVRCMKYPKLSIDEERLIAVFSEAQRNLKNSETVSPDQPLKRDEAWPASLAAGRPGTTIVPAGDIVTRARFCPPHDKNDLLAVWLNTQARYLAGQYAQEVALAFLKSDITIDQARNVRPFPIGGEAIAGSIKMNPTLH